MQHSALDKHSDLFVLETFQSPSVSQMRRVAACKIARGGPSQGYSQLREYRH